MSAELDYVRSIIDEASQCLPPATWRVWRDPDLPESVRRIEADGWVVAIDDELNIGESNDEPMRHHFVLASNYLPDFQPDDFHFEHTELGGVRCVFPEGLPREAHVRQFHFQFLPTYLQWLTLRVACGTPIKVHICGWVHDTPAPEEMDPEVHELGKFRAFDTSNRCPFVEIEHIDIIGRFKQRSLLSFRIPLTRIHVELAGLLYHRPPDAARALQGIQRVAQRVKPAA